MGFHQVEPDDKVTLWDSQPNLHENNWKNHKTAKKNSCTAQFSNISYLLQSPVLVLYYLFFLLPTEPKIMWYDGVDTIDTTFHKKMLPLKLPDISTAWTIPAPSTA